MMVRAELKHALAVQHPDLSKRDIESVVRVFFDAITARLADGGRVEIRGFGSFTTRGRGAHAGRDPRSGERVDVGAKRVPRFKPGKDLREQINTSVWA